MENTEHVERRRRGGVTINRRVSTELSCVETRQTHITFAIFCVILAKSLELIRILKLKEDEDYVHKKLLSNFCYLWLKV